MDEDGCYITMVDETALSIPYITETVLRALGKMHLLHEMHSSSEWEQTVENLMASMDDNQKPEACTNQDVEDKVEGMKDSDDDSVDESISNT
jgi:hypothetical protein